MLGDYLKEYRLKNNLSQLEMANLLETEQGYYSCLENGKKRPGLKMLKRITNLLKVKPAVVRGWMDENN